MKRLIIFLIFAVLAAGAYAQNEYKYVIHAYGGLKIGSEDRIDDMAGVDSVKVVNDSLVFYVGNAPYGTGGGVSNSLVYYTNATPMPEEVGGLEVGTTFDDEALVDIIENLLYPYQYPAFSSFSMSGQTTTLECGVEISSGTKTWTWATSNSSNVNANSIDIDDITDSNNLITGTANDGTEDVSIGGSAITKTTTGQQHRWRITGTNSQSEDFTRDFVVTWRSPFYYGEGAAGLSVAQIQGLTKQVTGSGNKTYTFNPSTQVMYVAYPASYGALSSILDPNGFETIADWTLSVVDFTNNSPDYEGTTVSYNVYEYDNVTTQSDFDVTFIF